MIVVISEVWPHPVRAEEYFRLAEKLRPQLESIDGFISAERFESSRDSGKYISISYWRDETALSRWRNLEAHRIIMKRGRNGILKDYRIRVTKVLWDYGMNARDEAPADSRAVFG
jgi:heme-degrading monooxygenase HmoA